MRYKRWIGRVLSLLGMGIKPFGNQGGAQGYRTEPNPTLELARVRGKLMLIGTNQAMKMLIEDPEPPHP